MDHKKESKNINYFGKNMQSSAHPINSPLPMGRVSGLKRSLTLDTKYAILRNPDPRRQKGGALGQIDDQATLVGR